jgi:hypothetical protein
MLELSGMLSAADTEGLIDFDRFRPNRPSEPPLTAEVAKSTAYSVTPKLCDARLFSFFMTEAGKNLADFQYKDAACMHSLLERRSRDSTSISCLVHAANNPLRVRRGAWLSAFAVPDFTPAADSRIRLFKRPGFR